jgi:hypothetical protein
LKENENTRKENRKEFLITLGGSVGIVFRSSGTLWLMLAEGKKKYLKLIIGAVERKDS